MYLKLHSNLPVVSKLMFSQTKSDLSHYFKGFCLYMEIFEYKKLHKTRVKCTHICNSQQQTTNDLVQVSPKQL